MPNKKEEVVEPHPKDLMGPATDTMESIQAFAAKYSMGFETVALLFILDELRRIHWGIDELAGTPKEGGGEA